MAGYNGDNLSLITPVIGGTGTQIWVYRSTDAGGTVDASGYITDGGKRGMRVGDVVNVLDTDSTYQQVTSHVVVTVSTTYPGAVDLSDGVSIGGAANGD